MPSGSKAPRCCWRKEPLNSQTSGMTTLVAVEATQVHRRIANVGTLRGSWLSACPARYLYVKKAASQLNIRAQCYEKCSVMNGTLVDLFECPRFCWHIIVASTRSRIRRLPTGCFPIRKPTLNRFFDLNLSLGRAHALRPSQVKTFI